LIVLLKYQDNTCLFIIGLKGKRFADPVLSLEMSSINSDYIMVHIFPIARPIDRIWSGFDCSMVIQWNWAADQFGWSIAQKSYCPFDESISPKMASVASFAHCKYGHRKLQLKMSIYPLLANLAPWRSAELKKFISSIYLFRSRSRFWACHLKKFHRHMKKLSSK
jgi:hypothetical protein